MNKKEDFRRKLCAELGGEYSLRDYYSFKQIYRALDDGYEVEIGFFDLKGEKLIITLFKDEAMVEAVYAGLSSSEVKRATNTLVEKYTGKSL